MLKNDNFIGKPGFKNSTDYESAFDHEAKVKAIGPVTTIDAVDPATTMALVNELKAKINLLIG